MSITELVGPIENSAPIHLQKAILWGPESVLMDSVEFFLKARIAWEAVKISSESGVDYLLQQIETLKPMVVILCQEKDTSDMALLMQLAQVQICSKVITVSMESNLLQVYNRQHIIMHDVSDLLTVVDHEYIPSTKSTAEVQATQ